LRQRTGTLAAELPRQHGFLAILVGADDMRTQLAATAAIGAGDLLLGENGVAEEGIGGGGHVRSGLRREYSAACRTPCNAPRRRRGAAGCSPGRETAPCAGSAGRGRG